MDELNPLALSSFGYQDYKSYHKPKVVTLSQRYDNLPIQKQLAIDFRLLGAHYEVIFQELKDAGHQYTVKTIRHWFSNQDPDNCKEIFDEMKDTKTKERIEDREKARGMLNESVADAVYVLTKGVVGKTVTNRQMESAKEILDRAGFGRQMKQEGTMQIESESMLKMAEAIKLVAQRQS